MKLKLFTRVLVLPMLPYLVSALHALQVPLQVPEGTLFVGDVGGDAGLGSIYTFSPDGTRNTLIPPPAPGSPTFVPTSLAFDKSGNLFYPNFHTGEISKINSEGFVTTFASLPRFQLDLAFDSIGNLFVSSYGTGQVFAFNADGSRRTFASGLSGPAGLAFDQGDNLFVAAEAGGEIVRFTPDGSRSTFASGLSHPLDLAFDSSGNLFVTNQGTGTIFKFTPRGDRTTFASDLSDLAGLAFDRGGNLYVGELQRQTIESLKGTIYAFTPDGSRSTFASGLTAPFSLAFTPAASSSQSVPETSSLLSALIGCIAVIGLRRFKFFRIDG